MDANNINVIALAYLGDSVYEVYIRRMLINKGYVKVDDMQKKAVKYVSAKGQVEILNKLMDNNILSDIELDIVRRGRNYKRSIHPKNTDIVTYKSSTGFEALIGYLYLSDISRLKEILNYIEVE